MKVCRASKWLLLTAAFQGRVELSHELLILCGRRVLCARIYGRNIRLLWLISISGGVKDVHFDHTSNIPSSPRLGSIQRGWKMVELNTRMSISHHVVFQEGIQIYQQRRDNPAIKKYKFRVRI